MECRVVAFDDDVRGVRSSIAGIYVHTQLATRFNDFFYVAITHLAGRRMHTH
jgi:hypothetical protein